MASLKHSTLIPTTLIVLLSTYLFINVRAKADTNGKK